jgi:hypothetical protein
VFILPEVRIPYIPAPSILLTIISLLTITG